MENKRIDCPHCGHKIGVPTTNDGRVPIVGHASAYPKDTLLATCMVCRQPSKILGEPHDDMVEIKKAFTYNIDCKTNYFKNKYGDTFRFVLEDKAEVIFGDAWKINYGNPAIAQFLARIMGMPYTEEYRKLFGSMEEQVFYGKVFGNDPTSSAFGLGELVFWSELIEYKSKKTLNHERT